MQHCVELKRAGNQPSLPLLGSFCLNQLGLQMRVRSRLVLKSGHFRSCAMDGCATAGQPVPQPAVFRGDA